MTKSTRKALTIIGTVLMLCLPVMLITAYVYLAVTPRQYEAIARVLIDRPKPGDIERITQAARQRLGKSGTVETTPATSVQEIRVHNTDPVTAANNANIVAELLVREHPSPKHSSVHVIQPASVPYGPVSPKSQLIMLVSVVLGILLAMPGVVILLVARLSRPAATVTSVSVAR